MTLPELQSAFQNAGLPRYRALQVYRWLSRGVGSFEEMSDLSKELREVLARDYFIANAEIAAKYASKLDDTVKYLFRMNDGQLVESVLMHYEHGRTICVSSQVGCKMNCSFCATGKSGFARNLSASEILAQVQSVQKDSGFRVSNIVLMGMGEPLDNYPNVLRFLELVSSPEGMNIGMRHISLSTCGVVDKIYDLAEKKYQLTLSISLHAPSDAIRSSLMPVNRRWGVDELLNACRFYQSRTGRRISFEYALISGVNDDRACARELAHRLRGIMCHVNLIPVNSVEKSPFRRSTANEVQQFQRMLISEGVNATVRRTLGADIDASCGQLRRRYTEETVCDENIQ